MNLSQHQASSRMRANQPSLLMDQKVVMVELCKKLSKIEEAKDKLNS